MRTPTVSLPALHVRPKAARLENLSAEQTRLSRMDKSVRFPSVGGGGSRNLSAANVAGTNLSAYFDACDKHKIVPRVHNWMMTDESIAELGRLSKEEVLALDSGWSFAESTCVRINEAKGALVSRLISGVKPTCLADLDCSSTHLGDEGSRALCTLLEQASLLTKLRMDHTIVADSALPRFCEARNRLTAKSSRSFLIPTCRSFPLLMV